MGALSEGSTNPVELQRQLQMRRVNLRPALFRSLHLDQQKACQSVKSVKSLDKDG